MRDKESEDTRRSPILRQREEGSKPGIQREESPFDGDGISHGVLCSVFA
jgi:hypothetical protein